MATKTEYMCNTCGYSYTSIDEIFWLDEDGKIVVKPLLMNTSAENYNAPIKGFFARYYCYECKKFISKFIISRKSPEMNDEYVFHLIEQYDDNPKIIQYDDVFQKCLKCRSELPSKAEYSFALDIDDELNKELFGFSDTEDHKFGGIYYGYLCSKCKKQINKFVITENDANLSDSEIKTILKEHTNDLTIFLRRDYDICPDCGEEVYYLNQNSTCPNCRRDRLNIINKMMVD